MPEHDQKERLLEGEAPDTDAQLNSVRADLVSYVRTKKGLPLDPIQLDVPTLSGLTDASIIEESSQEDSENNVIDFEKHTHKDSIWGLGVLRKRLSSKKVA